MQADVAEIRAVRIPRRRAGLLGALAALAIAGLWVSPAAAQTGGSTAPGSTAPAPTTTAPTGYSQIFPIPPSIPHYYGDGFGASRGKRSHQGQDVFAACNATLVSVSNGRVVAAGFQKAAGNYVIIRYKPLKQDYAYYHLAFRAAVKKKQRVTVGQYIGAVGQSGNASGCHLHFEMWVGKWFRGGRPVNPLGALQYWDSYS